MWVVYVCLKGFYRLVVRGKVCTHKTFWGLLTQGWLEKMAPRLVSNLNPRWVGQFWRFSEGKVRGTVGGNVPLTQGCLFSYAV